MFRTKKYTILLKNKTSSPEKKYTSCFMLVMAAHSSMAFSSAPKRAKSGVRHHLQLTFPSQEGVHWSKKSKKIKKDFFTFSLFQYHYNSVY